MGTMKDSIREDIEREYTVENGMIRNPGKFEGEAVYVPYFYDVLMDGFGNTDEDDITTFDISPTEREIFPELGDAHSLMMYISESGFVNTTLLYAKDVNAISADAADFQSSDFAE